MRASQPGSPGAKKKAPLLFAGIETFKSFAVKWTTGALSSLYPDDVKPKKTATLDGQRLRKLHRLCPEIGDVPLVAFTLEHAQRAM